MSVTVSKRYCNSVPALQSHLMNTQLAWRGHTENALYTLCMRPDSVCTTGWFLCVFSAHIWTHIQVNGVSFMVMAPCSAFQTFNVLIDRFSPEQWVTLTCLFSAVSLRYLAASSTVIVCHCNSMWAADFHDGGNIAISLIWSNHVTMATSSPVLFIIVIILSS